MSRCMLTKVLVLTAWCVILSSFSEGRLCVVCSESKTVEACETVEECPASNQDHCITHVNRNTSRITKGCADKLTCDTIQNPSTCCCNEDFCNFGSNCDAAGNIVCPTKGVLLRAEQQRKFLLSPNYPLPYNSINLVCNWFIESNIGDRIFVRVMSLNIENRRDFLYIYASDQPLVVTGTQVGNYVYSENHQVKVKFVTDSENSDNTGFALEYFTTCPKYPVNVTATTKRQWMNSPNNGYYFPPNLLCEWKIMVSPSKRAALLILWLALRHGGTLELTTLNETETLSAITVQNVQLGPIDVFVNLKFQTNSNKPDNGFSIEFFDVCSPEANRTANSSVQYITSPNYPLDYYGDLFCKWFITASDLIYIHMRYADVPPGASLTIYDGPLFLFIGQGQLASHSFITSHNYSIIDFKNPNLDSISRFTVEYSLRTDGCPETVVEWNAGNTPRNIYSPNSPFSYPSHLNCTWKITAQKNHRIYIYVRYSMLGHDLLSIWEDGNNLVNYPDGSKITSFDHLYSTKDTVFIHFTSRNTSLFGSFNLEFFQVCSNDEVVLNAEDAAKFLLSPNFGNKYPGNLNCTWKIKAASTSSDYRIYIQIYRLSLQKDDYLHIYYGSMNNISISDSISYNLELFSTESFVLINFVTNPGNTSWGFELTYRQYAACPSSTVYLTAYDTSRTLTSPNYPISYPPNTNCIWEIRSPSGKGLVFHLRFLEVDKNKDFLTLTPVQMPVGSKNSTMTRISGQVYDRDYHTVSNWVRVKFSSDKNSTGGFGFSLQYYTDCPSYIVQIQADTKQRHVHSPNYPLPYANDAFCKWNISAVLPGDTVYTRLTGILGDKKDRIDYYLDTKLVGWFNYTMTTMSYTIQPNNNLLLIFSTNFNVTNVGFQLEYFTSNECNPTPCKNNYACIDGANDYECTCLPGYAGKNCTLDFDECSLGFCENNSTCLNLLNEYRCECAPGFSGKNCSTNIDDCASNPCNNNAICQDLINDYRCDCLQGYTDNNCSSDIDDCATWPCLYYGECKDLDNDYLCVCPEYYKGKNCEEAPPGCEIALCHPQAVCFPLGSGEYECICIDGYEGDGQVICQPFCSTATLRDLNTGLSYTFDRARFLQTQVSNQKCGAVGAERPQAAAVCHRSEKNHGVGQFTGLRVLSCNATLKVDVQNLTSQELELLLIDLTLITSVPVLSYNELTIVAEVMLEVTSANAGNVPVKLNSLSAAVDLVATITGFSATETLQQNAKRDLSHVPHYFAQQVILPENLTSLQVDSDNLTVVIEDLSQEIKGRNVTLDLDATQVNFFADPKTRYSFVIFDNDVLYPSNESVSVIISAQAVSRQGSTGRISTQDFIRVIFLNVTEVEGVYPLSDTSLLVNVIQAKCVVYDEENQRWRSRGCSLVKGSFPPECRCTHFATFSMIVDSVTLPTSFVMAVFSIVGCSLSSLGMLLTAVIYCSSRQLRQRGPTAFLVNICICLLISNIILMTGIGQSASQVGCYIVTASLHYFLLAAWCWMTANAINMYHLFIKVIGPPVVLYKVSAVVSYLLPAVVALTTAGVSIFLYDFNVCDPDDLYFVSAYHAHHVCWLHLHSLHFGFLLPVGVMLAINFVLFIVVIGKITLNTNKIRSSAQKRKPLDNFLMSVALIASMGLTWVFGYFMLVSDDVVYQSIMAWIFTILNSFQGLLIFFFNCLRRRDVRNIWFQPICNFFCPLDRRVKPVQTPPSKSTGKASSAPTNLTNG